MEVVRSSLCHEAVCPQGTKRVNTEVLPLPLALSEQQLLFRVLQGGLCCSYAEVNGLFYCRVQQRKIVVFKTTLPLTIVNTRSVFAPKARGVQKRCYLFILVSPLRSGRLGLQLTH